MKNENTIEDDTPKAVGAQDKDESFVGIPASNRNGQNKDFMNYMRESKRKSIQGEGSRRGSLMGSDLDRDSPARKSMLQGNSSPTKVNRGNGNNNFSMPGNSKFFRGTARIATVNDQTHEKNSL